MKNLVKPLPWVRQKDGHGASAKIAGELRYYAYKPKDPFFVACLEGTDFDVWAYEFSTLDEAIDACNEHYSKIILDGISSEALAILEQHLNPTTPNP